MKPIFVLQHIDCETLGVIEGLLTAQNIPFLYIRAYAGDPVPADMSEASALIVMGGPMGVYETEEYPFLKLEMALIADALRAQKPVLGICLGSQLLASVLGSPVRKGSRKEIGWYPVCFSSQGRADDLLAKTDEGYVLHWHGDIFDLPNDATALASSDLTAVQAYRYGTNVYGFLFHLEVTEPMVRAWVQEFSAELAASQIDSESILAGIPRYLPGLNAIGKRVFSNWVKLVTL